LEVKIRQATAPRKSAEHSFEESHNSFAGIRVPELSCPTPPNFFNFVSSEK
jgi:hypothetical protein